MAFKNTLISKKIITLFVCAFLTSCSADSNLNVALTENASSFATIPSVPAGTDPNFLTFFSNTYDGDSDIAKHSEQNPDKQFIKLLGEAKKTLDICAYVIDSETITSAIINAHKRGVKVRIVVDADTNKRESLERIRSANIPVVDDGGRSAIMHNKFAVVDENIVWTGSFNFTDSASWKHCDNAIRINNKYLAENYMAEFEKMFTSKKFGRNKRVSILFPNSVKNRTVRIGNRYVKTFFAPVDDVSSALIAEINKATKNITFMSYSFTHEAIADAIAKKAAKGIKVKGIFEHIGSATGKDSSIFNKLSRANAQLFVYKNPNQTQALMHHKVVIIDGKTVTTGSFNFTYNASNDNDENMLVISSPESAKAYEEEFSRIQVKCTTPSASSLFSSEPLPEVTE